MKWSRRLLFGIVCVLAIGLDGLGRGRVVAAGVPAPTVGVRRNPVFIGPVRTGDFNGDGIADLAGSTADPANPSGPRVVTVAFGKSDGSLGPLMRTTTHGTVLAVGDLNADAKLDLVVAAVVTGAGRPDIVALRGNGDGTFATATPVVTNTNVYFALIADFDADGHADVAVGFDGDGGQSVMIERGHGDFTFTVGTSLVGDSPMAGVVADLNGDGKPDLVTANGEFNSLSIFLNQGAMHFSASPMTIAHNLNDIAAGDLNGDGRIDLVVASSNSDHPGYDVGYATVLMGAGNGTFAAPVDYPTAPGAYNVVLGDFNRDGIVDIATANRSSVYYDALCEPWQTWDSISIFPGMPAGLGARSDFSIGNQMKSDDPTTDRNTVESLASADVNGDHFADLVTSNGTIFLNKPADPNWAPTVDAGPDQVVNDPDDHFVHLYSRASDSDQDMLTYAWYDNTGDFVPQVPSPCFSPHTLGVHTYTVVVDDGHGHTATDSMQVDFGSQGGGGSTSPTVTSVDAPAAGAVIPVGQPYVIRWSASAGSSPIARFDLTYSLDDGASYHPIAECQSVGGSARSCQWNSPAATEQGRIIVTATDTGGQQAFALSDRFAVRETTTGGTPLNYGWVHADVGAAGAAGSATHDGFVYNGQGITIKGSGADIWGTADEFHFVWQRMNGDFSIDTRVDSLQNVNAWTKGGLMIRAVATDASSPHASIFVSPSKGIAYQRRMTESGASTSTAGPSLAAPVWLRMTRQGNVVSALYRHNLTDAWTVLGRETIAALNGAVDVGLAVTSHADGTLATGKFVGVFLASLPVLQSTTSFGGSQGSVSGDGTTYTIKGSGSDIWGTTDSFSYAAVPIGDNNTITIRVHNIGNTDPWAKVGVMIRETLDPWSTQADAIVSPGKGIAMQYRAETSGASASAVQINGAAPLWLKISRSESSPPNGTTGFFTWYSTDGTTWRVLGHANVSMGHGAFAGIAITSHHAGTQTTAVVDDIRIEQ